ncbi:sulfite exporter TauE/SafE family protein [Leucobacter allii]|uniref:sulfite exporter TauE/SafE family protein n=1 Tax=Leucobacter allii TaxID=2932247 RepID=UPI001FD08790|nr:sulfite exporter TauE/SafE family protein [Leucobacter allii]UOR01226.1 sulfite exporter TauE/SafE family protein [Leucobacter allii]
MFSLQLSVPSLDTLGWCLLAVGAAMVGFSKTALPGGSALSVALFAVVLPARESTGALLPLLMIGDIVAVWAYRRDADWRVLLRLAPAVAAGVLVGVAALVWLNDGAIRQIIGAILMALIAMTVVQRRYPRLAFARGVGLRIGYGGLSGFTTMVANAGGPVMSLYLITANFSVRSFLGTAAWFFALVNIAKLPFSIGLGLISAPGLLIDLALAPVVIFGGVAGRIVASRLSLGVFQHAVMVMTVLCARFLIVA